MTRRGWPPSRGRFRPGRLACLGAVIAASASIAGGIALAAARIVIRSADNSTYGRILESPRGFTLYVFCAGTQTRCTGRGGKAWPPLIADGRVVPARGSRIKAARLGSRKLASGKRQVTYYGQPLYLYKRDRKRRQTRGEDRAQGNGAWLVISSSGRAVPPPGY
jgi:predicted lipoprotein with Yx(FWY)xxD motif